MHNRFTQRLWVHEVLVSGVLAETHWGNSKDCKRCRNLAREYPTQLRKKNHRSWVWHTLYFLGIIALALIASALFAHVPQGQNH